MGRRRGLRVALAGITAAAVVVPLNGGPAPAATMPDRFQERIVFAGLNQPTNIEFAPNGRVFVAEKGGRIKVFNNIDEATPTEFADLSENVFNYLDRGLMGLALAPSFPADPYVYVLYSYDAPPGHSAPYWNDSCATASPGNCVATARLSRLQANATGDVMIGDEEVLIQGWCDQYPSHAISDLHFGQDGMLYASAGDGATYTAVDYGQLGTPPNPCGDPANEGGALRSQDLRTPSDPTGLRGALLRLNPVTGSAAPGNPRINSPDVNERRIVAYGFRNPFRFTIRPGTDEVWLGDVGWNDWEEINRVANPTGGLLNFGWPCFEGAAPMASYDNANLPLCDSLYPGLPANGPGQAPPYFTWNHAAKVVAGETCNTGSSSATGLAWYPTTSVNYPVAYHGALFFSDYSRRCIWAMKPTSPGGLPSPSNIETFATGVSNPVDLAIGPGDDLYYVDHAGGTVRRIRYYAGNQPPIAAIDAAPTSGGAPLTVAFSAAGSVDADADQLSYAWDFTDNGSVDSTAVTASFAYPMGVHTARLTVRDPDGATDTVTIPIYSGNHVPTAFMDTPLPGTTWKVGDRITFTGHATDPQQGTLPPSAIWWQLRLQHCSAPTTCHAHYLDTFDGVAGGSVVAPDHEYPSYLELVMVAKDSNNLTSTVVRRLDPKTVNLTFASGPTGRLLTVGSVTRTAPFTATFIQGAHTTVSAPTPQTWGKTAYTFGSWSDSGAQTHVITVPTIATTYRAVYTPTGPPAPPPGLVAGYSFDAGSGTTAADVSGNGNVGTIAGASWVLGKHGGALSFNGTSSRLQVSSSSSLTLTSGMTLAAWIRPEVSQSQARTIVQKGANAYFLDASNGAGPLLPSGGGTFGTSVQLVSGPNASAVGVWTHLAMTYDGAMLRLFVNGVQVATRPTTGLIQTTSGPLWIGGGSPFGEYFQGAIDDVQVFNRGLSATEIHAIMNNPVGSGMVDSTVPSVPTALTARVTSTRVNLSWTASTDNVGVNGYLVERCQGATCTNWAQVATPTGPTVTDSGRSPVTIYRYRVRAADLAGNLSGYSSIVSIRTLPAVAPRKP